MPLVYRTALPEDAAACVDLRGRTRENSFSVEQLKVIGVTLESWQGGIRDGSLPGHICLSDDTLVGYCFGDKATGEIVVLALLPEWEGRGIGKQLLSMMVQDFKSLGFDRLFLGCSSNPETRSHGFYRHLGWRSTGSFNAAGDEILEYFPRSVDFPASVDTERLILRPPVRDDASAMFSAYCQDAQVCRYMIWAPHDSLRSTLQFVDRCAALREHGKAFSYVLVSRGSGQLLGMLEARPEGTRVGFGYVLARAFWGQGLMPEAVQAMTRLAFAMPQCFRVDATCDVDNRASARTLEKSGFVREGLLARYTVHPNISAEPRDCWMYARCR